MLERAWHMVLGIQGTQTCLPAKAGFRRVFLVPTEGVSRSPFFAEELINVVTSACPEQPR